MIPWLTPSMIASPARGPRPSPAPAPGGAEGARRLDRLRRDVVDPALDEANDDGERIQDAATIPGTIETGIR